MPLDFQHALSLLVDAYPSPVAPSLECYQPLMDKHGYCMDAIVEIHREVDRFVAEWRLPLPEDAQKTVPVIHDLSCHLHLLEHDVREAVYPLCMKSFMWYDAYSVEEFALFNRGMELIRRAQLSLPQQAALWACWCCREKHHGPDEQGVLMALFWAIFMQDGADYDPTSAAWFVKYYDQHLGARLTLPPLDKVAKSWRWGINRWIDRIKCYKRADFLCDEEQAALEAISAGQLRDRIRRMIAAAASQSG